MIVPGSPIPIEINNRQILCKTLTRKEQRRLITAMRQVQAIDTTTDKLAMMESFFDTIDEVVEICCPNENETVKDSLGPVEAMEMAGKLIAKHFGGDDLKKKLESLHSYEAGNSARHAQPSAATAASRSDAPSAAKAEADVSTTGFVPPAWEPEPLPSLDARKSTSGEN